MEMDRIKIDRKDQKDLTFSVTVVSSMDPY